jgi:integrase
MTGVAVPAPADPVEALCRLAADGLTSVHSRRAYRKALADFLAWSRSNAAGGFSKAAVQAYRAELERQGLAPSTVNVRLSAIRKLAFEAADNGFLDLAAAAAIARVGGVRRAGVRLGNWLTREQAEELLALPAQATLRGKRDRALLALLLGAGLRRTEAAALTFEHIQERDGRWVVANLVGKGQRVRTVPIPAWTKAALEDWRQAAGFEGGPVFRPVNKGGRPDPRRLSAQAVFNIVTGYAAKLGVQLAPHDLRRTFAKLAHRGLAPLEQIQLSLGHASVQTTERYLGVRQDLQDAPCDRLGIRV